MPAGLIPQDFIQQLIAQADIGEIVNRFIRPQKKTAQNFFYLCPFHGEKTPSFSVSVAPDKQFFYCFGCHAHGNVIGFLEQHLNLNFPEAVEHLADCLGVTMPEKTQSTMPKHYNTLLNSLEQATHLYQQTLKKITQRHRLSQTTRYPRPNR